MGPTLMARLLVDAPFQTPATEVYPPAAVCDQDLTRKHKQMALGAGAVRGVVPLEDAPCHQHGVLLRWRRNDKRVILR